jgi:hypothetical protein
MPSFTDNKDRPWTLRIDVKAIQKIRERCKIDLADLSGKIEEVLESDPVLLVNALWLLVEDDAKGRNVSDVEFGEGLVGDAIEAATAALLEARADFFPSRKRSIIKEVSAKTTAVREKSDALVKARLNDPALWEKMEKAMEDRLERGLEKALTQLGSATD